MNAKRILSAYAILLAALVSYANPIVWLHGWNSDGALWQNLQGQMVASSHASYGDFLTLSYYDNSFGFNTDTPIEEVAAAVARAIQNFYDGRNDSAPIDVVSHSMGGLVFRSMIAQECFVDNSILRRYISLGTPHYGQNAETSYEAQQMKYGSSFLWHLGEAWHFDGRGWSAESTLCIAGLSDIYFAGPTSSGSYWDGLVHAWSASLGGDVPVRYVNRSHSSAVIYAKAYELCSCKDGEKDSVFCLMRDFLHDGSLPQSLTPTYGGSNDNPDQLPLWVAEERSMWSLFAQVHSASNCVPFAYASSEFEANYTINGINPSNHATYYGSGAASGFGEGILQIFGNTPTAGVHKISFWRPNRATFFTAAQPIVPEPGSCRMMRFYDSPDPTLIAEAAGKSVAVPLSWLAATGLVANVESLVDCTNKLAATAANGYTGAECWYYGVSPWDEDARAWITATEIGFVGNVVKLGFSASDAPYDRVHVQRTASLAVPFADVADDDVAREEDSVSIPARQSDSSCFYRLFVR